ncbi:MAG: helix-turn-helix domain-containing protein [Oscillospiraceae bacterium]
MHHYERIKELRVKNNISQAQISEILEIKQPQYHRYESGQREIPLHLLIKLADFYNVSLDYIAGRSDEEPSASKQIG